MHCEQIRSYLADYGADTLPAYKMSWVAQHLAGCDQCRGLVAAARRTRPSADAQIGEPAPVAATAELLTGAGAPGSLAVQRPVPPGVRRLSFALVSLLVLGAMWLVLRGAGTAADPRHGNLDYQSPMQSHRGVSLSLDSLVANQEQVLATFRFYGSDLSAAGDDWVAVYGAGGERLASSQPAVTADPRGVTVQVAFRLPAEAAAFRATFAGVNQRLVTPWALRLPTPPDRLEPFNVTLPGAPGGVTLRGYGMVSDLLQVAISVSEQTGATPRLFLRDDGGNLFAPSAAEIGGSGEILLKFAVPKTLRLPIRLVGEGYVLNYLGPWTIEANVLK